jgi:formylglycine-generating enzyme required for sulfatase activity
MFNLKSLRELMPMTLSIPALLSLLLLSSCVDFPAFPSRPILQDMNPDADIMPDMMRPQDQRVVIDQADQRPVDMEQLELDMDLDLGVDQSMEDMMVMVMDMAVPVDPYIDLFNPTRCNNNNIIEGTADLQTGGVPCLQEHLKGTDWVRVDPPSNGVPFPFFVSGNSFNFSLISDPDRRPVPLEVNLDYTYFMMRREVTISEYNLCPSENCTAPDELPKCSSQRDDNGSLPANCITWESANNYCRWIGGALPTEVEWEIAASQAQRFYPTLWGSEVAVGDDRVCEYAYLSNCQDPSNGQPRDTCAARVNTNPREGEPSLFCDTTGNVGEWILDDFVESITLSANNPKNGEPYNAEGDISSCEDVSRLKVLRGGSFQNSAGEDASLFARDKSPCTGSSPYTGFRCVISTNPHTDPLNEDKLNSGKKK